MDSNIPGENISGEFVNNINVAEAQRRLEIKFITNFVVMELIGVHPTRSGLQAHFNPYLRDQEGNPVLYVDNFSNIGAHLVATAMVAEGLCDLCQLPADSTEQIVNLTLLHDINKVPEIMRKSAKKNITSSEGYRIADYLKVADFLVHKTGLSYDKVQEVIFAGECTGHNSLNYFVRLNESGEVVLKDIDVNLLRALIIHLADDMISTDLNGNSELLSVADRMDKSKFFEKYPWMYTEGFGYTESGVVVFKRFNKDKSFFYVDENESQVLTDERNVMHFNTYAGWQVYIADLLSEYYLSTLPKLANTTEYQAFGPNERLYLILKEHLIAKGLIGSFDN